MSDFGITKEINGKSIRIGLDGTERYLSPELKIGMSQSEKSDIWVLGVGL